MIQPWGIALSMDVIRAGTSSTCIRLWRSSTTAYGCVYDGVPGASSRNGTVPLFAVCSCEALLAARRAAMLQGLLTPCVHHLGRSDDGGCGVAALHIPAHAPAVS